MVTCSKCGQVGHNRRSAHCPQNILQEQQPQQQLYHATLYSLQFMGEHCIEMNDELYDRVLIPNRHFANEFIYTQNENELHENDDHKVFLIKITVPSTLKSIVVNVGGPHREYDMNGIYAPTWVLEALNINELGQVTWERLQQPPVRATKISLRPLDPMMEHIDARAEIEEHLKLFNVLQEGTTISVPLRPFDNYIARVFVEKCEPEPVVLLRDEVELDLLESPVKNEEESQQKPVQPIWQPSGRPPTPIPEEATTLFSPEVQDNHLMTPLELPLPLSQDEKTDRRRIMAAAAERRLIAQQQQQQLSTDEANTSNRSSN